MKKNWMQGLSLLLSVVLLVVLFKQYQTAEDLRKSLQNVENRLYDLEDDVNGISSDVTRAIEEAGRQIADYELRPVGIDSENRTLEANVVLQLREWSEDATVELEAVVGRETFITLLPVNGNGICTGQMAFPVNQESEVKLSATVTSGGVSVREHLGGWGNISMLLPVRLHSWGGSVPAYEGGKVIIRHHEGDLEDQNGQAIAGINTRYRLYINEQLVKEEERCQDWEYACGANDEIRLTLACEDEFGLGYEFLLYAGTCQENGTIQETSGEGIPILTWS